MQSYSSLSSEEQAKVLNPHEYIRNTVNLRYQDCISCGNRTEFTCIKCGYCYSCHWKKEQVEEIELRNNLKDFHASLSKSKGESTHSNNDLEWKQQDVKSGEKKSEIWGTLDVLGRQSEPICTYYRCHHRFSLHGSSRCRCKHPNNKALGVFVRYL
jgi:hypothetical protein